MMFNHFQHVITNIDSPYQPFIIVNCYSTTISIYQP